MKKTIRIRPIEKNDLSALAEFLTNNALPIYTPRDYKIRFDFWWKNNPAFDSKDHMGWIIEDLLDKNYIKGFLGNIPTLYKVDNKNMKAVSPSTWIVLEEYRKYSITLLLAFLKQKKDIFINSTPAEITEKIFLKLGFIDIAKNQNNYLLPLNHKPIKYLVKKMIYNDKLSEVIGKIFFITYNTFLNLFFINSYKSISMRKINNNFLINKILSEKKYFLKNFEWILDNDKDKFFYKIENLIGSNYFIFGQYINNPINKLKYIQILETNIKSGRTLLNVISNISKDIDKNIDYIILHNLNINYIFFNKFIKFNYYSPSKCLVKSDKIDVKLMKSNGSMGEKAFILWS